MAFQRTTCSNENCPRHTDYRGGRFVYSVDRKAWFCQDCINLRPVMNEGMALWDFTTTHFNGEAIHVKGLSHLRQLERQFGCSNHAANYEESKWSQPPAPRSHTLHPKLVEVLGKGYQG